MPDLGSIRARAWYSLSHETASSADMTLHSSSSLWLARSSVLACIT